MTKFSVIIPTYNNCFELENCLNSLVNQTYKDFEVIVINDGSTEDYSWLMHKTMGINISYIKITNSGGPARPRNIGISKSVGEYTCFLDSDDLWLPNYLESILKHCESYDFLCTAAYLKKGSVITKLVPRLKHKFPESILLKGNPIFTSSVTIRKDLIMRNKLSFNENRALSGVEDLELWFRLLNTHKVRFKLLKEPLIYYKIDSESLSNKDYKGNINKHKELFKIFEGSIRIGKYEYFNYLQYILSIILFKNDKIIESMSQVFEIKLLSRNGIILILKYLLRITIIKGFRWFWDKIFYLLK
jgi:glycosyltransferase involved in cell wall biosynthesis